MRVLLAAGVALALAGPAAAQDAADSSGARTAADALIGAAEAQAYFTNISEPGKIRVRHDRSGMVCSFEAGAPNNLIVVYPRTPFTRPGDDVSCNTTLALPGGGIVYTTYATRYQVRGMTSETALDLAARELKTYRQGVTPWTGLAGDTALAGKDGKPSHPPIRSARFTMLLDGQPYFTKISVVQINGWSLKLRASAPVEAGDQAEFITGAMFAGQAAEVTEGRSGDKTAL